MKFTVRIYRKIMWFLAERSESASIIFELISNAFRRRRKPIKRDQVVFTCDPHDEKMLPILARLKSAKSNEERRAIIAEAEALRSQQNQSDHEEIFLTSIYSDPKNTPKS